MALVTAAVLLVASVALVVAHVGRASGPGVAAAAGSGSGSGFGSGFGFGGTVGGPGMRGGAYGPATTGGGSDPGDGGGYGYGPGGMMGGGDAPAGVMGGAFGLAGDGQPVTTFAAARARAQAFADQLASGLHAGEVMQFSNGYYSELMTADGQGATEVLIDQDTGAVSIEQGPALMWNTRYGMHPTDAAPATISAAQAVKDAQAWLDAQHTGLTAGEVTAFPGYDTLHTLRDGKIVGMMSINASTGAAWYHTWHGTFLGMDAG